MAASSFVAVFMANMILPATSLGKHRCAVCYGAKHHAGEVYSSEKLASSEVPESLVINLKIGEQQGQ